MKRLLISTLLILATMLHAEDGLTQTDIDKSKIYKKELNTLMSEMYKLPKKDRGDKFKEMITLSEKMCDEGSSTACKEASDTYSRGVKKIGVQQDAAKALRYIRKGCDLGNKSMCKYVNDPGILIYVLFSKRGTNKEKQVKEVIDMGVNINEKIDGMTLLNFAKKQKNEEAIKILTKYGAK